MANSAFSQSNGGSGTGTVTSVSVVTANGISGSVASSTTTPAITLTLGAITPSSIVASGTVAGSNLSGTNTGDQTITLTGNVTGSGTGSFATTIAAGVVTLSMMANIATASILGRNTAGTGSPEVLSATTTKTLLSLNNVENTALSTWAGTSNITTLGTIATGTWSATTIAVNKGGTGQTSYTDGQLLIGNTSTGGLSKATLTAGTNVTITNGNGTITIASSGGGGSPTIFQTYPFGLTTNSDNANQTAYWTRFVALDSTTLTTLRAYCHAYSGTPNTLELGIYSDVSTPAKLASGTVTVNATGFWSVTISQAVTAGTVYWLGLLDRTSDASTQWAFNNSNVSQTDYTRMQGALGAGMPTDFTSATSATSRIYWIAAF